MLRGTSCKSARSYWSASDSRSRRCASVRVVRSLRANTVSARERRSAPDDPRQIETPTPPRPGRIARTRTGPSNAPRDRARRTCHGECTRGAKSSDGRREEVPDRFPMATSPRHPCRYRTPLTYRPSAPPETSIHGRSRAARGSRPVRGYTGCGMDWFLGGEAACDHAEDKSGDQERCDESKHSAGIHGDFLE